MQVLQNAQRPEGSLQVESSRKTGVLVYNSSWVTLAVTSRREISRRDVTFEALCHVATSKIEALCHVATWNSHVATSNLKLSATSRRGFLTSRRQNYIPLSRRDVEFSRLDVDFSRRDVTFTRRDVI